MRKRFKKLSWEDIAEDTQRLKVFQGWIIKITGGSEGTIKILFISDKKHKWRL